MRNSRGRPPRQPSHHCNRSKNVGRKRRIRLLSRSSARTHRNVPLRRDRSHGLRIPKINPNQSQSSPSTLSRRRRTTQQLYHGRHRRIQWCPQRMHGISTQRPSHASPSARNGSTQIYVHGRRRRDAKDVSERGNAWILSRIDAKPAQSCAVSIDQLHRLRKLQESSWAGLIGRLWCLKRTLLYARPRPFFPIFRDTPPTLWL